MVNRAAASALCLPTENSKRKVYISTWIQAAPSGIVLLTSKKVGAAVSCLKTEYKVFESKMFRRRIYQEIRQQKFIFHCELHRRTKAILGQYKLVS
jgi:hypothetical protein